jgi:lysophospholipase L1-like esterase
MRGSRMPYTPPVPARLHRLLLNLLLLCGSLLLCLIFAEIALRIVGFSSPDFWRTDPMTGLSLRPHSSGWVRDEGEAFVEINSHGMRDREIAIAKPGNTYRIAFLGDSMIEARQVPREEGVVALVEQELQTCPAFTGKTIETLNFGTMGYGTTQEYLQLQDRVWQFQPDAVVLAFMLNDVENNSKAMEGNSIEPYFVTASDGQLMLDESFKTSDGYRKQELFHKQIAHVFLTRSRLAQLLYLIATRRLFAGPVYERSGSGTLVGLEPGVNADVYRAPATPIWDEAWKVTEHGISLINDAAKDHGARFAVITLSTGIQVHPDPKIRSTFKSALGITDLLYPNHRVTSLAERLGIPFLTLAESMRAEAERTGTFFHGFPNTEPGVGHWNSEGHRFAAKQTADFLCAALGKSR